MPEKVSIFVEGAPRSFGHFAQVVKFGDHVHISGQLPLDPATNRLVSEDMADQSRAVLKSLTAIMQACAGQVSNVLSTRIYLVDLRDHKIFDQVSKEFFFFTPPTRTVIPVPVLPVGAKIMLEAQAILNPIEMKGGSLL